MGSPSFVLADINNLSSIFTPLKSTQRIKYTCFNVSHNFLIFGATSGGLYVFKRDPCTFLQLLPNKEGAVTHLAVSPDEKLFAYASVKGVVCVLERNVGPGARRVQMSSEHQGSEVTALHWNGHSNELYIGDNTGKVSVINVSGFVAKNMFNTPSFQMMQLDSRVVQLDWQSDLLLVSTLTRSYLCDTVKEQYRQIGHKPREGEYGGCFYVAGDHTLPVLTQQRGETHGGSFISLNDGEKFQNLEGLQNLKMFCARPGSRLWEVESDGTVLSTHQFKQALAVKSTALIRIHELSNSSHQSETNSTNNPKSDGTCKQQSFNFSSLLLLANRYLFTFKKDGIYVFDPEKVSVVLWSNDIVDIIDAQIQNDIIYVRTGNGNMHALQFSSLEKFLIRLYLRKQYTLCAQLCEIHSKYLMEEAPTSTKLHLLADLKTKLSNDEVAEKILPLLQEISKYAQETKNAQRLDSGIFVVGNQHFLRQTENVFPDSKRAERFKDKTRSLSVSPETTRRKKKVDVLKRSQKSESSASLPELGKSESKTSSRNSSPHSRTVSDIDEGNNNTVDPSFPPAISPEAIQALKEIGQTVSSKITNSTKSLKEKWQVFEDKIRGHETPPEPLDVRPSKYADTPENVNSSNVEHSEVVFCEKRRNDKGLPELDVSNVTALCAQLSECGTNDVCHLTYKLFDAIIFIYEDFITALDTKEKNSKSKEMTNLNSFPTASMNYYLTRWCSKSFPFNNYFSKDINKAICDTLHESLKAKVLISWLQNWVSVVESNVEFVEQLTELYPLNILKLDVLLSRLLIVCSDLLETRSILQCIMDSGVPSYYLSFCTILEKYQEGALQYATGNSSLDNTCWEWPMPLLLNAMFFMLRMDQIETCCMMGNNVDIKHVCYLVLRLEESVLQSGESQENAKKYCYSKFLCYLDKISEHNTNILHSIKEEQLVLFVTMAFEFVNNNLSQNCECGFPLPMSGVAAPQFAELGEMISSYYWQTNHNRLMELCRRIPIMWRYVPALKQHEDISFVLPLIIQLGDTSELEKWLPKMNQTLWEQALTFITTLRSGKCLNCGAYCVPGDSCISLSAVGTLMIKCMGPQAAVDMLLKYVADIKPGELDERFFQSCIFSAIVDSHATGLRSEVCNVIGDAGPLTKTALFSSEMGKVIEETLEQDLGKVSLSPNASKSHHWGVCVDLEKGTCPCCALPLGSDVLICDGGLTVFHCGHSYHAVCLKQRQSQTCLICSKVS